MTASQIDKILNSWMRKLYGVEVNFTYLYF